jgi:hypothetical protein
MATWAKGHVCALLLPPSASCIPQTLPNYLPSPPTHSPSPACSRIQQLKLLSKLEQSGLLSLLERQGLTLSKLEQSGALSAAERLGVVSLLGDRNFPGTLYTLAAALLAAGPAAVYFLPDDSTGLGEQGWGFAFLLRGCGGGGAACSFERVLPAACCAGPLLLCATSRL